MIYITGDCHSEFDRFSMDKFPVQAELTKDDYIIICGDFGGVWDYKEESKEEKDTLDWLDSQNFTTLFIDGNHENFQRLYNYPEKQWHGGKVHEIRPSILHLMRGEIFDIDGKKFFTFGGAASHDIDDGILSMHEKEAISEFRRVGAKFRIRNISWWDLELPREEEMENGIKHLEEANYKVDYIITHCAPTNIQTFVGRDEYEKNVLTDYLQKIAEKCEFKKWYFGHYHTQRQVNSQFILLYEDIIPLMFETLE